jgi:hypothetical protein
LTCPYIGQAVNSIRMRSTLTTRRETLYA